MLLIVHFHVILNVYLKSVDFLHSVCQVSLLRVFLPDFVGIALADGAGDCGCLTSRHAELAAACGSSVGGDASALSFNLDKSPASCALQPDHQLVCFHLLTPSQLTEPNCCSELSQSRLLWCSLLRALV